MSSRQGFKHNRLPSHFSFPPITCRHPRRNSPQPPPQSRILPPHSDSAPKLSGSRKHSRLLLQQQQQALRRAVSRLFSLPTRSRTGLRVATIRGWIAPLHLLRLRRKHKQVAAVRIGQSTAHVSLDQQQLLPLPLLLPQPAPRPRCSSSQPSNSNTRRMGVNSLRRVPFPIAPSRSACCSPPEQTGRFSCNMSSLPLLPRRNRSRAAHVRFLRCCARLADRPPRFCARRPLPLLLPLPEQQHQLLPRRHVREPLPHPLRLHRGV